MIDRRTFLGAIAGGMVAPSLCMASRQQRKRMAIVTTEWRYHSHAWHMGERFLVGYPISGRWHHPPFEVVSAYVDQQPENDLSRRRSEEFGLPIYPSIAEALRCGGDKLAVDAVLVIGEHGDYPRNEIGQKLYPRYEFFKDVVAVFEAEGRSVPMFNDKHLSWKWEWAKEMVDTAHEMGFPLLAGSSLPVTWRMPSIDLPYGAEVDEVMCVAIGGVDSYDFHALETQQCMAERRAGGEYGVRWVQAYRGDAFWRAHHERRWSNDLFAAALCRSHTLKPARAGCNDVFPTGDDLRQMVEDPIAYQYEHLDGLKSTMILMNGLIQDFNFAAHIRGESEPLSTQMYLPMPGRVTLASFFSPLVNSMEKMFLSGRPTYPVERTLLTSGLVIAACDSLHQGQIRIDTPHLDIAYQPTEESTFWRT